MPFFAHGHDSALGETVEIRLVLQPIQHSDEVLGWVKGRLLLKDRTALLVEAAIPLADFQVAPKRHWQAQTLCHLEIMLQGFDLSSMFRLVSGLLRDLVVWKVAVFAIDVELLGDLADTV